MRSQLKRLLDQVALAERDCYLHLRIFSSTLSEYLALDNASKATVRGFLLDSLFCFPGPWQGTPSPVFQEVLIRPSGGAKPSFSLSEYLRCSNRSAAKLQ